MQIETKTYQIRKGVQSWINTLYNARKYTHNRRMF